MTRKITYLVLPILLFIASCQKNYIVPNRSIVTQIRPGNWITTDNGVSYKASIDMPEIDDYLNENGAILAYISFGSVEYEPIPQVFEGISYRYVTRPGQIIITIESSEGSGIISAPRDPMDVKIVLIDAE